MRLAAAALTNTRPRPPRQGCLSDLLGLAPAVPVVADEPVPPFTNSTMDGCLLSAEDTRDASPTLEVGGDPQQQLQGSARQGSSRAQPHSCADPRRRRPASRARLWSPGWTKANISYAVSPGEKVRPAEGRRRLDGPTFLAVTAAELVRRPGGLGAPVAGRVRTMLPDASELSDVADGCGPLTAGQSSAHTDKPTATSHEQAGPLRPRPMLAPRSASRQTSLPRPARR